MNNFEEYRTELDRLRLTKAGKQALLHTLTSQKTSCKPRRRRRWSRAAMVAAVLCIAVATAGAVRVTEPILQKYYQNSPAYQQSSAILGMSQTRDGWTLTLTDCVGDNSTFYLGFELTAPEGTVLDPEEQYCFDGHNIRFRGSEMAGSRSISQLEDPDPTDNTLYYRLDYEGSRMEKEPGILGSTAVLELGRLYHYTVWNEEAYRWDIAYDNGVSWKFEFPVEVPNQVISMEPGLPVTVLGVEATLTELEVSPIGIYARMEGDSLKGHHGWVSKAPDGGPWCWDQEATLYTADGRSITFTEGQAGSGCSGGTDPSEDGMVYVVYRFEAPIDVNALDRISICGVEIPLQQ